MKRRTKEQKMRAQQHREQQLVYQYKDESKFSGKEVKPVVQSTTMSAVASSPRADVAGAIFGYDVKLIYRDLLKTIAITCGILLILFLFFFLMRK